jgi:hypothetical protein
MANAHPQRRFLVQYDTNYDRDVCDLISDELWAILEKSPIRFEDHGVGHNEYCGTPGVHTNEVAVLDLSFDDIEIVLPEVNGEYNLGETVSISKQLYNHHGDDIGSFVLIATCAVNESSGGRVTYTLSEG